MKMEVRAHEKVHEMDKEVTIDRPLLLFGHFVALTYSSTTTRTGTSQSYYY
jgi:hypothetical protein